ncbi:D-glycerate dehydrogenase [Candidatus Parcubacteria bacterium]|nr:D-glycerate dehydrogenase [Candidatus Parcubacteria bacterium]
MKTVFVTRRIPESGIKLLESKGCVVDVSSKDGVLSKEELVSALRAKPYDAVLCLLTDKIDGEVFDAAPQAKIFANYAVGFNNIDLEAAKERGVIVSNTPDVLTETVAEHTVALLLALASRVTEGDRFTKEGKYVGWDPLLLLGTDLSHKTLGILGAGRIGARVAHHLSRGFDMNVAYYDVKRNEQLEQEYRATYYATPEEVLAVADAVTIHVPLLPSTQHLLNKERLGMMKPSAFLVNTSRGPVIDEVALVEALKGGVIRGAALDVFENEPALAPGLASLPNVILTPHIASATGETREKMSTIAAENVLSFFETGIAPNAVKA